MTAGRRPVVFLHIGAMKTGTTYLQQLMLQNQASLLEAGVVFPTGPGGWRLQVEAVRDVMGTLIGTPTAANRRAWASVHEQIFAHDGTSVLSMEFMSFCDRERAGKFVRRLEGADVRVILGLRDASRLVPAVWQEGARNYGVRPWPRFVAELTAAEPDRSTRAWKRFLRVQDAPRMLDAWLAHLPAEKVHVLTVPRPGAAPDLLWRRFADIVGIDAAAVAELPTPANESLGHASAELARRVNLAIGEDRTPLVHKASVSVMSKGVLAGRQRLEAPVRGDAAVREFGARWNAHVRDAVLRSGVSVSGDLDDLPVLPAPPPDDGPDVLSNPTVDEMLDAAAYAIVRLRRRVERRTQGAESQPKSVLAFLESVPTDPDWDPKAEWLRAKKPLAAAVGALAASVHAVADAPLSRP
ncbi:MAG TPA: hypothetical protein VLI04_19905 [Nocardioidaceae bacterium]|nr:hypothetical protein [Nocardioidaceae bacterium]